MVSTCAHHLLVLFHICTPLTSGIPHMHTTIHKRWMYWYGGAFRICTPLAMRTHPVSLPLPPPSLSISRAAARMFWNTLITRTPRTMAIPMPEAWRLYRCYLSVCTYIHTHIPDARGTAPLQVLLVCVYMHTYSHTWVHRVCARRHILKYMRT